MTSELNNSHLNMVAEYTQKAQLKQVDHYMLTIARDGEQPVRSIYFYGTALEAAAGYVAYLDWGFA